MTRWSQEKVFTRMDDSVAVTSHLEPLLPLFQLYPPVPPEAPSSQDGTAHIWLEGVAGGSGKVHNLPEQSAAPAAMTFASGTAALMEMVAVDVSPEQHWCCQTFILAILILWHLSVIQTDVPCH